MKSEVVDSQHGCGARRGCESKVHGNQTRLPVVAMHNVGTPLRCMRRASQFSGDAAELGESLRVVVPWRAIVALVRPAAASV